MSEKIEEVVSLMSEMPMLALRGITVFPNMLLNFDVERHMSIAALEAAMAADQRVFLVTQREIMKDDPAIQDLYKIGTVSQIKQLLRIPGGVCVMLEGKYRGELMQMGSNGKYFQALVKAVPDIDEGKHSVRVEAMMRQAIGLFEHYTASTNRYSSETMIGMSLSKDPGYIADFIAQHIYLRYTEKQSLLEEAGAVRRLGKVNKILIRENEIIDIGLALNEHAREQIARNQREFVLREQMKVIQAELGDDDDLFEGEDYQDEIIKLHLMPEQEEKLLKEASRLSKHPPGSSEGALIRSYLDTCLELPWNKTTKERVDIVAARKILDSDHYGLEKVKERIIEFLSVKQLAPDIKGVILCLVGPPGVGKTSIAASIARALNRKFVRMSLGGVRDEAEIRGHRKTYIGAMPGRIISAVRQAKSKNPILLLDELDKLGSDYRGDPSAALLEALDPEQNSSFRDHFLEIPFDLSQVLFITTANTTDTIPRPLLDRMELIEILSYTDEEKLQITKNHLLPKQRKKHGLTANRLKISDDAIREIIACYTKESGVRQLERELARICRKTAASIASGEIKSQKVTAGSLQSLLGVRKYTIEGLQMQDEVGIVKGLAWTAMGGEILEVEVNVLKGTGKLELTGNLGDVMKESAKTAVSYIRSRAAVLEIDPEFYKNSDIHIHFPEGAVPKDGPSAGITIAVATISALTGAPVRRDLAMTGEISLRGRILPIGGLKEKTMAAMRSGVKTVIIPAENEKDLEEIDQNVRNALYFITTDHIDKILKTALDFSARKTEEPHSPGIRIDRADHTAMRQ